MRWWLPFLLKRRSGAWQGSSSCARWMLCSSLSC
jgi:hypothetical protein